MRGTAHACARLAQFTSIHPPLDSLCSLLCAAGGALQASSRTMMVRHADPRWATEAFGLYALSGKATAFLAPALIFLATWATGSPRLGISPLIGLFLAGLILLAWVKPDGDQTRWSEPSPASA